MVDRLSELYRAAVDGLAPGSVEVAFFDALTDRGLLIRTREVDKAVLF